MAVMTCWSEEKYIFAKKRRGCLDLKDYSEDFFGRPRKSPYVFIYHLLMIRMYEVEQNSRRVAHLNFFPTVIIPTN